jgi:hypothetical protein
MAEESEEAAVVEAEAAEAASEDSEATEAAIPTEKNYKKPLGCYGCK